MIGATILGFFIGLMISLTEIIFRKAWLEVNYGPRESRTVNLGAEPISIGSDQNNCAIYARNAAPVSYIYQLQQGHITCKDAVSGAITVVQPGYQQQVGNAVVTVQSGKKQVQAGPAGVSSPVAMTPTTPYRASTPSSGPVSHFVLHLASKPPCLLELGKRLNTQDIPGLEPLAADNTVAQINSKPGDTAVLGLQNLSRRAWQVTYLVVGNSRLNLAGALN